MLAFLARYGHQSMSVMLKMPVTDLVGFQEKVSEIMREEKSHFEESLLTGDS